MSGIAPYAIPATLARLDGRTREGRLLRRVRSDLTAHVGGKPSAPQRMLIERAATLALHVGTLDRKVLESGTMTEHDSRTYLAWSNSLTRTLRELGVDHSASPQDPGAVLRDYMASKAKAA